MRKPSIVLSSLCAVLCVSVLSGDPLSGLSLEINAACAADLAAAPPPQPPTEPPSAAPGPPPASAAPSPAGDTSDAPPLAAPPAVPLRAADPNTPPPMSPPLTSLDAARTRAARQSLLQAPTFALDVARIIDAVFSVSAGFPINRQLEAGGIFAAGSPERARISRFHTAEVGGYLSWFGLGSRVRGVGFTARTRYLYGWGEGETDAGDVIETSAHALTVSGLVMARYTAVSGLRLEVQSGLQWISSRAIAVTGAAEQKSELDALQTTLSLLIGWTF